MLWYVLACMAWGFAKASVLGAHRAPGSHFLGGFGLPELAEELEYRVVMERGLGQRMLGVNPAAARLAQAALFGLAHPGLEVDAAVGGFVYSKAFDQHGLLGAVASHVAHNAGVWLGSSSK
ncbi:MAG: CPBP family intramembrane metalloprotease [Salinibacterium sp.]|nr:MAG: CPBP family intramembrane metalloprotease [Salinibacterium sp.]